MEILGVDIGGSGIKGAPVDVEKGAFAQERLRLATPKGAPPREVARLVAEIVTHSGWTGPLGATFPAGDAAQRRRRGRRGGELHNDAGIIGAAMAAVPGKEPV